MEKQNVVYPYNGIVLSHRKKWSTDTCYDMDEPRTHYVKWKKADIKHSILEDSIYKKHPEQATPQRHQVEQWLPGACTRLCHCRKWEFLEAGDWCLVHHCTVDT